MKRKNVIILSRLSISKSEKLHTGIKAIDVELDFFYDTEFYLENGIWN